MNTSSNYAPTKIGVCVLTYNSSDIVLGALAALEQTLAGTSHEIVVVDNNSQDDSAGLVERNYPSIQVVRNPRNSGYARGNNLGCAFLVQRGCNYLVVMNPDVTVRPNTIGRLVEVLGVVKDAGCAGGLAMINGRPAPNCFRSKPALSEKLWIYSSCRYFPVLGRILASYIAHLEKNHFRELTRIQPVYTVSGACIAFPSDVFVGIKGFDEHTFLYQEELIISEKLVQLGLKVYGVPDAVYDHLHGHSAHATPLSSKRAFIESERYLLKEYYQWNPMIRGLVLGFRWLDMKAYSLLMSVRRIYRAMSVANSQRSLPQGSVNN